MMVRVNADLWLNPEEVVAVLAVPDRSELKVNTSEGVMAARSIVYFNGRSEIVTGATVEQVIAALTVTL